MSELRLGPFVVDRFLRATPGGPVYLARHTSGEAVWLYTLDAGAQPGDARSAEFARRQAAAVVLGRHARSPRFLDAGAERDMAFYAVSAPSGEPLQARVSQCSSPAANTVLNGSDRVPAIPDTADPYPAELVPLWMIRTWINDLASVVSYAHEHGIIVGNISPYVVWIAPDGCAVLSDPGCGPAAPPTSAQAGFRPVRGERCADAGPATAYLAPEQLLGWPVGPAADIYALGAILFWLLGGAFPYAYRGDTAAIGRYLPLPMLPLDVEPTLAVITKKATALQPKMRYQSADLLRADILAPPARRDEAARDRDRGSRSTLMYGFARGTSSRQTTTASGQSSRLLRWLQEWL